MLGKIRVAFSRGEPGAASVRAERTSEDVSADTIDELPMATAANGPLDDASLAEVDRRGAAADDVSLSDKAKAALGRSPVERGDGERAHLQAVVPLRRDAEPVADEGAATDVVAEHGASSDPARAPARPRPVAPAHGSGHPLDGLEDELAKQPMHDLDSDRATSRGAVIEIKNGAKSGQILPIDKPVTTLGRPGIQIAAIMRKPDGYFLMHIESDDSIERPTLNRDSIGDEPVLLHSGDELNVAGIDVEFMLS